MIRLLKNKPWRYLCTTCILILLISHDDVKANSDEQSFNFRDLYACDTLYCPDGHAHLGGLELLEETLGFRIEVNRSRREMSEEMRVVESVWRRDGGGGGVRSASQESLGDGLRPLGQSPSEGLQPRSPSRRQQSRFQQGAGQAGSSAGIGGGGLQQRRQGRSLGPGQVHAGGLLYSDVNGSLPSKSPGQNKNGKESIIYNQSQPQRGRSAVEDNLRSQGQSRSEGQNPAERQIAAAALGASQNDPFGQYESSGGSRQRASGDDGQSSLKKIASRLGLDRFFGSSGGQAKAGEKPNGQGSAKRSHSSSSKRAGGEAKKLPDPNSILQRKMQDYHSRQLANSPEFGDIDTSIFRSMCQHYIRYAKRHQIPRSPYSQCPN